jgi:AmmeMemoRadiSam system protein A
MKITDDQKQTLRKLARNTIEKHLGLDTRPIDTDDPLFQQKSGVFVTLQKNQQLRGCIGSLSAHQSILDGVQDHAVNAAFNDNRFAQVTPEELADISIEISILTEPQPLQFTDASDLLKKLQPGKDGVILKYGYQSSTFLPQVWEQLPDPEQFLSHLAIKAGLPADWWQKEDIQIETYQVIKF